MQAALVEGCTTAVVVEKVRVRAATVMVMAEVGTDPAVVTVVAAAPTAAGWGSCRHTNQRQSGRQDGSR
jgi:hypothetical protein